jgi:hypothetical protein
MYGLPSEKVKDLFGAIMQSTGCADDARRAYR